MRTLIVYESASAYLEARTFARELAGVPCFRELPDAGWKLDLFRIPTLCGVAAGDAAQAEVIIVAYEHAWAVPSELEDWLGAWERVALPRPQTLVALHARNGLTPSSPKGRQLAERLCGFALARGIRFIGREDDDGADALTPPEEPAFEMQSQVVSA